MDGQPVEQPRALEDVADPGRLYAAAGSDHAIAHPHLAVVWRKQAGGDIEQRGFSTARGSEQADELARLDVEADCVQHRQRGAITAGEAEA